MIDPYSSEECKNSAFNDLEDDKDDGICKAPFTYDAYLNYKYGPFKSFAK